MRGLCTVVGCHMTGGCARFMTPPEVNMDSLTGPLGQDIDNVASDLNTNTPEHLPVPPSPHPSSPPLAFPTTYSSGCPIISKVSLPVLGVLNLSVLSVFGLGG